MAFSSKGEYCMIKLFTAPWCSACKPIKALVKRKRYDVEIIDVDTEAGSKEAASVGVRALPTLTTTTKGSEFLVGPEPINKFLKEL